VLVDRLRAAGCIAAEEEAAMLADAARLAGAAGAADRVLEAMVRRRERGEPVEWIVGWAPFCGLRIRIADGVYVPRVQTEVLARRAAVLASEAGVGAVVVDLATGSGAIAAVVRAAAPAARVIATEIDPVAAACARANGVEVYEGDLDAPVPAALAVAVDVLVANVPYVPTEAMGLLARDVLAYEPRRALDGGADGLDLIRRVFAAAARWLGPHGRVLVEIGPDQGAGVLQAAAAAGLAPAAGDGTLRGTWLDEEGDPRAFEAVRR